MRNKQDKINSCHHLNLIDSYFRARSLRYFRSDRDNGSLQMPARALAENIRMRGERVGKIRLLTVKPRWQLHFQIWKNPKNWTSKDEKRGTKKRRKKNQEKIKEKRDGRSINKNKQKRSEKENKKCWQGRRGIGGTGNKNSRWERKSSDKWEWNNSIFWRASRKKHC